MKWQEFAVFPRMGITLLRLGNVGLFACTPISSRRCWAPGTSGGIVHFALVGDDDFSGGSFAAT
jgi:hypothetical protein